MTEECGSSSDGKRKEPRLLDLRGLKCPLPVLRTRKALRRLAVGETLCVTCTDPLATIDIPHMVRTEGHRLLAQTVDRDVASFLIEVAVTRSAALSPAPPLGSRSSRH